MYLDVRRDVFRCETYQIILQCRLVEIRRQLSAGRIPKRLFVSSSVGQYTTGTKKQSEWELRIVLQSTSTGS